MNANLNWRSHDGFAVIWDAPESSTFCVADDSSLGDSQSIKREILTAHDK